MHFLPSWIREGEEEEGMAGAALLATQSKLGRPLLQDEITFVRMQVVVGILYWTAIWMEMSGWENSTSDDRS